MTDDRVIAAQNTIAARVIVEELRRLNCAGVVICPGSRSTPLVAAFAQLNPLPIRVLHDERSGAFFALGWARAAERPVAIVTTSGTAVANLLPAFVEADRDRVPLLALSADRPFENHGTDANQTVNQREFLKGCARKVFNLAPPDDLSDPSCIAETVQDALQATLRPIPGPVQLNCMFRKPLEPDNRLQLTLPHAEPSAYAQQKQTPQVDTLAQADVSAIAEKIRTSTQGIVFLGATTHAEESRDAVELATFLGWPLVSCALANLPREIAQPGRSGVRVSQASILAKAQCLPSCPDVVLWLGGAALFPELTHFIAKADFLLRIDGFCRAPSEVLNPNAIWAMSANRAKSALEAFGPFPQNESMEPWRKLEEIASATAHNAIYAPEDAVPTSATGGSTSKLRAANAPLDEPTIASLVIQSLDDNGEIFVGNSMPIRDVALFSGARLTSFRIFSNRGASGIDGLVSTAAGIASQGEPLVALLGDLSFLYDVSVWTSINQMNLPLRVVVVENGGGGIFDFLPIAENRALLDPYFYTPHKVDLAQLMRAYGIACRRVETRSELWDALSSPPKDLEVIIARSDRDQNVSAHQARYEILRHAVEQASVLYDAEKRS